MTGSATSGVIGIRERLAYAAGDTGFNFVWQSIELYLLFFYVDTLGLPIGVASAVFLAGAVVDWLADPLVGALADRAAPRLPLRAWLLLGGPGLGAALALAFAHPALAGGALVAWVTGSHLLLRLAYSVGNIPYGALTARLSADPRDQVALTSARMQGAAVGGLIATGIHAGLPSSARGDYLTGALILGVLAQPLFLLCWAGVRERVQPAAQTGRAGRSLRAELGDLVVMLRVEVRLRQLVLVILAAGLAITTLHKSILFLFQEQHASTAGRAAAMLPALALLLTAPGWAAAARRYGRMATLRVAAALNLLALLGAGLAGSQLGAELVAVAIAVAAGCGMSVAFWALVPAMVTAVEAQGGVAAAARVFALGTLARKLGQALAPQLLAASMMIEGSVGPAPVVAAAVALLVVFASRLAD